MYYDVLCIYILLHSKHIHMYVYIYIYIEMINDVCFWEKRQETMGNQLCLLSMWCFPANFP